MLVRASYALAKLLRYDAADWLAHQKYRHGKGCVTDDFGVKDKSYHIRIHGTTIAANELRVGDVMVVLAGKRRPSLPGDELREPAFGLPAMSLPESFADDLKREGLGNNFVRILSAI